MECVVDGTGDPRCPHVGDCGVFGTVGNEPIEARIGWCEGRDRLGADAVDISEQALEMIEATIVHRTMSPLTTVRVSLGTCKLYLFLHLPDPS